MANYTYGTPPFATTTFTSPLAGIDDKIVANALANFTITGNGGNDVVQTAGGNDTITTTTGNDTIAAGDGNNTVIAGDGTNSVTSGSGNDTITTGAGNDEIAAGDGNNTVTAGDGTNSVTSGSGNDTVTTGSGADIVNSGGGSDIVTAGSGNDIINAGSGDDTVNAGTGNDSVTSGGGLDSLTGGGGQDTFVYGSLADTLLGADTISDFSTSSANELGEGDVLDLKDLVVDFTGLSGLTLENLVASGHLDFSGDSTNTVISLDSNGSAAGGSTGVLVTLAGVGFSTEANSVLDFADNITTGNGVIPVDDSTTDVPTGSVNDPITMTNFTYGTPLFTATTFTSPLAGTNDVITAINPADFTINGNGGEDSVTTGSGNDTITTTTGNDMIAAGDGNNTVTAGDGTNAITTGRGNDTITTGTGNDTIAAGDGNNTVTAGDGTNAVTTGSGNDTITTGDGADSVNSGGGDDIVNAGTGDDRVTPGGGSDSLTGGGGHDTFVFGSLADARLGADTIADFSTSNPWQAGEGDMLDLGGLVNDFSGVGDDSTLAQLVASGHLNFSASGGGTAISYDSNGSTCGGDVGTLVTLVGVPFSPEGAAAFAFGENILV